MLLAMSETPSRRKSLAVTISRCCCVVCCPGILISSSHTLGEDVPSSNSRTSREGHRPPEYEVSPGKQSAYLPRFVLGISTQHRSARGGEVGVSRMPRMTSHASMLLSTRRGVVDICLPMAGALFNSSNEAIVYKLSMELP